MASNISKKMKIEKVITGYLEENCYIISYGNNVLVIDPGDEATKIMEKINNRKVLAILITHSHFDHIGALSDLQKKYKCLVVDSTTIESKLKIADFEFTIIKNPGHSKDSISFYFEKENVMFVGDFIFKNSIGRCDLEGGSLIDMKNSLNNLNKFKKNIILYPGHGDMTSLDYEKKYNVYLQ